ncbi:hypothetical protein [Candidatus Palauibacter sp.]|uniref:hypothetical protein n=1 Tax=Candidatus Palauibacter sp. TaxID=3101350 RepID=UPI003B52417F
MSIKQKSEQTVYKADYGDASPKQVAEALLKYRPKDAGLSRREAAPKPARRQP